MSHSFTSVVGGGGTVKFAFEMTFKIENGAKLKDARSDAVVSRYTVIAFSQPA